MGIFTLSLYESFGRKRRVSLARKLWLFWHCVPTQPSLAHTELPPNDNGKHFAQGYDQATRVGIASALWTREGKTSAFGVDGDIHKVARASMEYLRDGSDGFITIENGVEEYNLSSWAHAQLMRIVVCKYAPTPHFMKEALQLVEDLRAEYAREGRPLRPYRLPDKLTNNKQRIYAQVHVQRFGKLKPFAMT